MCKRYLGRPVMLIDKIKRVDNKWHTETFRRTLEDHLTYLRRNTAPIVVYSAVGLKYQNNFIGLLNHFNYLPKYHHSIMRVNKITNPRLIGVMGTIYLPDLKMLDKLISILDTKEQLAN